MRLNTTRHSPFKDRTAGAPESPAARLRCSSPCRHNLDATEPRQCRKKSKMQRQSPVRARGEVKRRQIGERDRPESRSRATGRIDRLSAARGVYGHYPGGSAVCLPSRPRGLVAAVESLRRGRKIAREPALGDAASWGELGSSGEPVPSQASRPWERTSLLLAANLQFPATPSAARSRVLLTESLPRQPHAQSVRPATRGAGGGPNSRSVIAVVSVCRRPRY